jgi:hypothetical protein
MHHVDRLEHAVQKVSSHAEWLIQEYEMQAMHYGDRSLMPNTDFYVWRVIFVAQR